MKLNVFNVKEKKEKRIILEEERIQNPFLLFLKRHKNFILISMIMILICLLLISTGIAFSLFRGSNDYDITYIEGSETIDSNTDPDIDDEDIKDELLGEIAREEGIVLLVKIIMTPDGDVIYYYTDRTAVVIRANGKIYRVSTKKNGKYGINEKGKFESTAIKILVTSTTTTLQDGTIITNYSDGSAKVEYKTQTYFVRDSNNIKLENGNALSHLAPSGVAPMKEKNIVENNSAIKFTDNTSLVVIGDKKYIVNKNANVSVNPNGISYDQNNAYAAISEKTYKDGNTITHYTNGSATITDPEGNVTYVKKSGDLLMKDKKLYEIFPNITGISNSRATIVASDDKKITYFDNGAAVIINPNGTRQYVEDNDEIVFDGNKLISSTPTTSPQFAERLTEDGLRAYSFENGKTEVIKKNGTSYIIDTSKLEFKPIEDDDDDDDEDDPSHGSQIKDPADYFDIQEIDDYYKNDIKSEKVTIFKIRNKTKEKKDLRIAIEEVENYEEYISADMPEPKKLPPKFVKFLTTIQSDKSDNNTYNEGLLANYKWQGEDKKYVIYEGTIAAGDIVMVSIGLTVDYSEINDEYQNSGFIGTIRIYVDDKITN